MFSLMLLLITFLSLFAGSEALALDNKPAVILVPGAFHKAAVYDSVKACLYRAGYGAVDAIGTYNTGYMAELKYSRLLSMQQC
jgi:hypothetical protein